MALSERVNYRVDWKFYRLLGGEAIRQQPITGVHKQVLERFSIKMFEKLELIWCDLATFCRNKFQM